MEEECKQSVKDKEKRKKNIKKSHLVYFSLLAKLSFQSNFSFHTSLFPCVPSFSLIVIIQTVFTHREGTYEMPCVN